ncbi:MAG: RluA family pseudouridine synthase [Acidimicrobiia bacterium]|nr:RluA family pseudouridine synthase [Acidimicrobiia bacterium]
MSERAHVFVTEELDGVRIDRTLAVLAGLSRTQARQLVEGGEVTVGGTVAGKTTIPRAGDQIDYPVPAGEEALVPEPVAFRIALETDDVIVVDKPAGVVVHPGAGNQQGTLAHGLAYRFPELAALGDEHRWGLVHRLDRDTSGLLLVARNAAMHRYLQEQLQLRSIGRTYLALVAGHLGAATGTIEAPIGRDPLRPTRMAIVRDGRPARTHYTRLESWDECTLVEVELETGRTHQIRVHFSSIGNGLVGDHTYGDVSIEPANPGRVWLHATRLRFTLPDGARHEIESPLPDDLQQSLARLRAAGTRDG